VTDATLSGIVGPTHWQRTGRLIEAVRPMARQARLRSSTARRSTPPRKRNATAGRRGKPWRLLRVQVRYAQINGPGADCVPRPLVSELPLDGALGARLASRGSCTRVRCRLPLAAICFGLRRALRLGLRIADSFGQHLAQLSLGLRWFPREGFLPLYHKNYVGMTEGELNPKRKDQRQQPSIRRAACG
jgi:hypothetical protein